MDAQIVNELSLFDAMKAVKNAVLENACGEQIEFYKNALLRLTEFHPDELNPTSLYALRKHIDFQRELRECLLRVYGIDTLLLASVLHLKVDGKVEGMIPPYVEISEERVRLVPKEGDRSPPAEQILKVPLLLDGLHRVLLARELKMPVRCIVSSSTDRSYLHCAYPNTWAEVVLSDEVPKEKKYYRRQERYSFMRPLDILRLLETAGEKEYGR